jgi:hypothetical protein
LAVQAQFSTAYHPETDGLAKRTNQWLEGFLRSFCNYRQDDWAKWLPIAEFCHNNQVNSATGQTAFKTVYGLEPRWDHTQTDSDVPHALSMGKEIEEVRQEARAAMEYNRTREGEPVKEFEIGDKVWLVTTNIKTKEPIKKQTTRKWDPSPSSIKSLHTHTSLIFQKPCAYTMCSM